MSGKYGLFSDIGIDSIAFNAPRHYLDVEGLAKKRDVDPKKYKEGLLLKEMRLPELNEDIISMGLKAGYNALQRGGIHPKDIDAVFVGTETMTYAVKSASNIFAQLLGIRQNSMTQDVYNACAAGTLAIINGIALIEKGVLNKALIICADMSSYQFGSPSEPTQGAGAIALVLSRNPRIATFSKKLGKVSGNVNDFYRRANEKDAQVFGHYSVKTYLDFQLKAYDNFIEQIGGGDFFSNYYAFHAPFSKMPLKIMQEIIEKRWGKDLQNLLNFRMDEIKSNITQKIDSLLFNLVRKSFTVPEYVYLKLKNRGYSSQKLESFSKWLIENVKDSVVPQLTVPMHFGNMYSASVWAQVLFILENYARVNDTIYFGSYGSGATCISGLLQVQPQFKEIVDIRPNINDYINNNKIEISVLEYELLKKGNLEPVITIGKIKAHEDNDGRGFTLHFCDEGCIIPHIEGLNYCPQGHSGFHTRFFPLYATLTTELIKTGINTLNFLNYEDCVRVSYNAQKGNTLEYEIRRVNVTDPLDIQGKTTGLLNWAPTYIPIQKLY